MSRIRFVEGSERHCSVTARYVNCYKYQMARHCAYAYVIQRQMEFFLQCAHKPSEALKGSTYSYREQR